MACLSALKRVDMRCASDNNSRLQIAEDSVGAPCNMDKINFTGIREDLLRAVGVRMANFGFVSRPRRQAYVRKFNGGHVEFHLAFVPHTFDFDVIADMAVRFDQVEDMVNADRTHLSKQSKKETCSLGVELGNLINGKQMRWTVEARSDLEAVADEIVRIYQQHGEPYFERYSSAENAYAILKGDDREAWLHCPFHNERAFRAVALGRILGALDLDEVIQRKTAELTDRNNFDLPSFLEFVQRVVRAEV